MSALDKKRMLEDILNDYVASEPNPNHASLEKWIRKYPEYKEELTEFTVNWSLMENLPPSDDIKEVDQDTLVLRAMSIVEDRIHAHAQQKREILIVTPNLAAGMTDIIICEIKNYRC